MIKQHYTAVTHWCVASLDNLVLDFWFNPVAHKLVSTTIDYISS